MLQKNTLPYGRVVTGNHLYRGRPTLKDIARGLMGSSGQCPSRIEGKSYQEMSFSTSIRNPGYTTGKGRQIDVGLQEKWRNNGKESAEDKGER